MSTLFQMCLLQGHFIPYSPRPSFLWALWGSRSPCLSGKEEERAPFQCCLSSGAGSHLQTTHKFLGRQGHC